MKPQVLPPNVLRHFYAGGARIAAFRGLTLDSDHMPEEWIGAVNTTFGSVNREYLPGLKNAEGTLAGFFNSAELALFEAAEQDTPGLLKLLPSSTEAAVYWSGPAYMDASIDASLAAMPPA